jgi:hypothetical protein
MKANCRRRRHSRHTVAHVTYSDLFLLAQWQSNSSHDSCLAVKAAASPPMRGGAVGDDGRAACASAHPQARRSATTRTTTPCGERRCRGPYLLFDPVGPQGRPWMWASGHDGQIKRAAHGYAATREQAMAAFAESWRRSS